MRDSDYRRLRRATIFARFKYDEALTHSNAIFGNTQGVNRIYYDAGKKVLELRVRQFPICRTCHAY